MVSMLCGNSIKTGNPHLFQVRCQIKSKLLQISHSNMKHSAPIRKTQLFPKLTVKEEAKAIIVTHKSAKPTRANWDS